MPFRDQTTDLYLSMDLTGDMGQGDPFRDYTPALRVEEYQKAIDIQCRLLERQTGFSPGTFSFDLKSGRMTATQVVSDDKETYIERQIRRWKREQQAMKSAGQPQEEAKAKLKEWRARQTDLVEQTGLKRQYDRERAGG